MGRKFVTYGDLEVDYTSDADLPAAKKKLEQMILEREYNTQVNAQAFSRAASQTPIENLWSGFKGELGGLVSGGRALVEDIPVLGYAVKLLPRFSQETEANIDINRQLPQYSPAALAGQTAGMVAGSYGLGKVASLPGRIPGATLLRDPAAVNAMTGALYNTLAQPSNATWGDRAGAAASGALLGGGPSLLGRGFGEALRANPTPEAQALMAKNIPLTWGEQAGPGVRSNVEHYVLETLPITGAKVRAARTESGQAWDREMMRKVSPEPTAITQGGTVGYRQLRDSFTSGYQRVESRAPEIVDPTPAITNMRNSLAEAAPKMNKEDVDWANKYITGFQTEYKNGIPYGMLKEEKRTFNAQAMKFKNAGERTLGSVFDGFRKEVDNLRKTVLSPEDWAETKRLDGLYTEAQPIFAGHTRSVRTEAGYMTPKQLAAGIYEKTPKFLKETKYARGEMPMQAETKSALERVYHQPIPQVGPGTGQRIIGTGLGIGTVLGTGAYALGGPWWSLAAPAGVAADYWLSKNYGRLLRPYDPGWLSKNAPGVGSVPGLLGWDYLSGGPYGTGGGQ